MTSAVLQRLLIALTSSIALLSCRGTSLGWDGSESARAEHERHLDTYKREHQAALGSRIVAELSEPELLKRLDQERVLWLGDRHTDIALHGMQRDLLAELRRRGRHLVLALEAVGCEDDGEVARYLAGTIDQPELRLRIRGRWPESWLDSSDVDHSAYRALLADARTAGDPVFGIEPAPRLPLRERDAAIGARVRDLIATHPDRLVVVLVGQAHLGGEDHAVAHSGSRGILLVPDPGDTLQRSAAGRPRRPVAAFLQSDTGVLFPATAVP
ncbi:MAG: ChaN family lipoprotein [Planctomycetota bacterium]